LVQRLVSVLKFALFVLAIPLIFAAVTGFINEILLLDPSQSNCFFWGIISYLLFHLFIAEPTAVYQYGKGLVADIFKFFQPLVVVAPLILPIFAIFFLILLYLAPFVIKTVDLSLYFLFFASFTFAMHLVLTAKELRAQDAQTLRSDYFFSMTLVFFVSVLAMAGMIDLCLNRFSFIQFLKTTLTIASDIYQAIFNQLFIPR